MSQISITAIILTYNEEMHLQRCIDNLKDICQKIVVVDSFSTDSTQEIAEQNRVAFVQNQWVNYARQFNWALKNINIETEWVLRIDADEYLSDLLKEELRSKLQTLPSNVTGVFIKRLMLFMDKPLRKGGMYPIWHIKIWRNGFGYCENRWMDERIILRKGETIELKSGDLIDHNLNNMSWWTSKHNIYAVREMVDILDGIYNFTNSDRLKPRLFGTQEQRKRWLKVKYLSFPLFLRPVIYWTIRYFFLGGFLEGRRGFIWNYLHAFWYRFLVDVKLFEVLRLTGKNRERIIEYFKKEYDWDITEFDKS